MADSVNGRDDPRFREIGSFRDYQHEDLARTHRLSRSDAAARVDPGILEEQHRTLLREGFVIIEGLATARQLERLRSEAQPFLDRPGRNSFEGERTQRIYGLPGKLRVSDELITHPQILAHLDKLLQPNYLLSQAQVINIMSGSPAQPLHMDDGFYPWPRPRAALSVATVFAVDDFTGDNGATLCIPQSHRWAEDRFPEEGDTRVQASMPAGSCILFLGNLWHGGGENYSGASRLAFTAQYCEPYLRTQENYFLSVPKHTVAGLCEDMLRLLGYSIHPPFMGMADGVHPKRALDPAGAPSEK